MGPHGRSEIGGTLRHQTGRNYDYVSTGSEVCVSANQPSLRCGKVLSLRFTIGSPSHLVRELKTTRLGRLPVYAHYAEDEAVTSKVISLSTV